jgi:Secretion system C-terminal sorting domain
MKERLFPGFRRQSDYTAICRDDSLLWEDDYYKETVRVIKNYTSVINTDSIRTLDLMVHERPNSFEIVDLSGQDLICEGETIRYGVSPGDECTYNWWSDHGEIVSGQGNDTVEFQWTIPTGNPTLYSLAHNSFGCVSDTSELIVELTICDGLEESVASSLKLFPVPVHNRLWIESEQEYERIELVNMMGELVFNGSVPDGSINFSEFSRGAYFLRVFNRDGILMHSRKVVKL